MVTNVFSTINDEILTEIFSRVPAKSVGKFKCLSKTWNSILSSPYFVRLHLSRKIHQPSLLLSAVDDKSLHIMNLPFHNPTITKKIELGNDWYGMIGSCNGLVLLLTKEREMVLVNPITHELFKVPKLTFETHMDCTVVLLYGFGYDSSTDDYKIIVVSASLLKPLFNFGTVSYSVDVYTLKSGVWRRIDNSPYKFAITFPSFGTFVNGSIHWHQYDTDNIKRKWKTLHNTIIAFDLSSEVFHEVDIPLNNSGALRLFAHEGHLCALTECYVNAKIDVWMMEEYGTVNTWTKLASVDKNREMWVHMPLCFNREEDVLLVLAKIVRAINIHEETITDMVADGGLASFCDGCSFVGSLVSIKGMTSSN